MTDHAHFLPSRRQAPPFAILSVFGSTNADLTFEESALGQQLLDDMRLYLRSILSSSTIFDTSPSTRIQLPIASPYQDQHDQVTKDGRALELTTAILFHCMGYRILERGDCSGDGGVDVKVRSADGTLCGPGRPLDGQTIVIQCKQRSKAIVGSEVALHLIGSMFVNVCNTGVLASVPMSAKTSRH